MTVAGSRAPGTGVVLDYDVAESIPAVVAPHPNALAFILVRVFTEPLGVLIEPIPPGGLPSAEVARAVVHSFGAALRDRLEDCGIEWREDLPVDGLRPPRVPKFLQSRELALRDGPRMTVAVCTRDRPDDLALLLASLREQEYRRLRVLVVDNAPSDNRTRLVVSDLARRCEIDYAVEPRPGLSMARNRALEICEDEVVAWADDDATCDRWWAAELARGFVEVPEAGAVTGIVVPRELETQSQVWFEEYSGVRRGRGFTRATFSPATAHRQSPLYPLPPFGSGNNMAFRLDCLARIGGFDPALGVGSPTLGGEDTAALSTLLLEGGTIVYQPTAVVFHRHRRDDAALRRAMLGYGRGLSAYYVSMLVHRPGCALELLGLSRTAMRDQFSRTGRRLSELDDEFPSELLRANRLGLLQGPFFYVGARLRAWHQTRRRERRPLGDEPPDATSVNDEAISRCRVTALVGIVASPTATVLVLASPWHSLRFLGALVLACVPAGAAVMCWIDSGEDWAQAGLTIVVSLAVFSLASASMIWIPVWHPPALLALAGLGAVSCAVRVGWGGAR